MTGGGRIGGPGGGTSALANALDRAGHHWEGGLRPRADLVFAALGGVGFHYALVGHPQANRVAIDGSAGGFSASGERFVLAARGLGANPTVHRYPDDDAAEAGLHAALHSGGATLVWTDLAALPYNPMPRGYQRSLSHAVGVVGHEGTDYLLDDRSERPLPIDGHRLRMTRDLAPVGARALLHLPPEPAPGKAPWPFVIAALVAGLREHLDARLGNRGVAGMSLLAARLRDPSHEQGWRRRFGRGLPMFHAHCALFRFLQHGAGPGLGRPLLAAALRLIGQAGGRPELLDHADRWRAVGSMWSALADAALPYATPGLNEARQLLAARMETFLREGIEGVGTAESTRLTAIAVEMDQAFPLSPTELAFLHAELAGQLDRLAAAERLAAQRLLATLERSRD